MVLTWPIDKVDPSDIPAFQPIYEAYKHLVPDLGGMLKFLCYRFDQNSQEVRAAVGTSEKDVVAQRLSAFLKPIPNVAFVDENGTIHMSDEWKQFSAVSFMFFPLLNNAKWELMTSMELAMDEGNAILREPIPIDADPDLKAKSQLLKINTAEGGMKMIQMREKLMDAIADGDEAMISMIDNGMGSRKKSTRSKRDNLTGKKMT